MEQLFQSYPEDARRIGEEYLSSLTDLNCNSKPLINMLTMLAEENINYAHVIVRVVEYHISQVAPEFKLPILYLIDSIIKNVKSSYVQLFGQCIVNIFLNAFESVQHSPSQVLEKVRERMYLLRQTWNEVFPPSKMYSLDVKVKRLDNNWPITAKPVNQSTKMHGHPAIHVNPDFLKTGMVAMPVNTTLPNDMEEILQAKTRELLELRKRKLELELEQTKLHLKEQERQLSQATDAISVAPIMPAPAATLRPPGMESAVPPVVASTIYPGGMRNMRPVAPAAVGAIVPVTGQQPPFVNKPKVNPVNPAMLSSVRQRDPRLARQMQSQASTQMAAPVSSLDPRLDSHKTSNQSSSTHKSSRSRSKSPMRNTSNNRSNKGSSHQSSSSGNSSRKRSESKSSTASTSSSGSDSRHKGGSSSSNLSPGKRSSGSRKEHNDRYAHNGGSPVGSKRKSSSPASSPTKSKRNALQKPSSRSATGGSKSGSSNNARSRSRSPIYRDVDMRNIRRSNSPETTSTGGTKPSTTTTVAATLSPPEPTIDAAPANDLEKRPRSSSAVTPPLAPAPHLGAITTAATTTNMDVDLRPFVGRLLVDGKPPTPPPPAISIGRAATATTTTAQRAAAKADNTSGTTNASSDSNATISSSKLPTKVSFKIQKPFNKLEKSTAHLSTATLLPSAPTVATTDTILKQSSPVLAGNVLNPAQTQAAGEKRSASQLPVDIDDGNDDVEDDMLQQPQQKRSKSAKLDALFGSEDVDLRRVLPSKPSAIIPSGVIVLEDDSMDNWETSKQSGKSLQASKKPSLDELRAKLVKTVRPNNIKLPKDKTKEHPVAQRIKQLAELKSNDDSQEAHDEKMRTILTQAHEIYENHGMNQEQYKELVSKVVDMNESSKLKDSKRRETVVDEEDLDRNAARDAVLRKRIPKLKGNENHASSSPRSDGYEEPVPVAIPEKSQPQAKQLAKSKRESKRRKPSKWGEQVDPAAAQRAAWQVSQNNNNNGNKRIAGANGSGPGPGFRGMPWQHQNMVMPQSIVPPPPQPPSMIAMPPVPPVSITKAINSLDNPMADVVRSITIDGGSKEIRFYNQVAIIFMDGDEPHEIGFQHGQRSIYIDHNEPLALNFNDDYKPFQLDGQLHRIRFGHPSRELYIDDHWYEIYFGGPPVSLPIGNKLHVLKAEGPPPNVDIGRVRRDLVVGKINMIVDAHTIVPLFLDGRQQTFHLGAEQHSLQFVDSFLYALLDGQLQRLEYGGLPKSMKLNGGRTCFIRFGTLPKGVQSGKTHVQDMVYIKTEAPAEPPQPPPLPVPVVAPPELQTQTAAAAPIIPASSGASAVPLQVAAAALSNLNIDELFQKLVSSGIIGGPATTAVSGGGSSLSTSNNAPAVVEPSTGTDKEIPAAAPVPVPSATPSEPIKRIDLHKPDTIKTRQSAIVSTLYLGMQCSSCGVRFPPEQTIKYSQHLDWHFRQNRRERDSTRKATSRRWFYDLNDWRQYEEIEDVEEREKNFLEAQNQQIGPDANDDVSQQRSLDSPMPSCPAGAEDLDRSCDVCHEKFEQFYNEELEEWHLRSAIRVEDKIYHPLCYEDYKISLNPPAQNDIKPNGGDEEMLNATDDNAMDTLIKLEDDSDVGHKASSTMMDDDDDDVIVLPNEEPSVTEIVDDDDDEEYVPQVPQAAPGDNDAEKATSSVASGEEEHPQIKENNKEKDQHANESDVEIQEPNIPFTDLDTYVEKEPVPMLNVKIKEEPKDDDEEDEDDGFEDVGTVVQLLPLPEDEISIHSSETQTQTIDSSASPATMERPASVASLSLPGNEDELELEPLATTTSASEAELNGENPQETHNLSAAGPAPALPLASIVNKIKINITKNTSSNSHNSASTSTTASTMSGAATDSQVSAISVIGGSGNADVQQHQPQQQQQNSIQTISTIPVLCGGNTFVPKIATSSSTNAPPANISSISVIGSNYGSSSNSNNNNSGNVALRLTATTTTATAATSTATGGSNASAAAASAAAPKPMTPPPAPAAAVEADPEPVIELKPALQNVTLKKTKKVQNGIETSGLCSIM